MSEFKMKPLSELLENHGLGMHGQIQRYVDSSVLRYSAKYIPKDTGTLIKSGTIHTVIGSGRVHYETPYAREVYYSNAGRGKNGTANGGLRGKLGFERMKADCKDKILKGAQALADKGGNYDYTLAGMAANSISGSVKKFKKSAGKNIKRTSRSAKRFARKKIKLAAKTVRKKYRAVKRRLGRRHP